MPERAPGVAKIRANHERSPFSRQADASAPPPLIDQCPLAWRDMRSRAALSHASAAAMRPRRARLGKAVPEHRFHLRAVFVAEPPRSEAEQQSIAVHWRDTFPGAA